MKDAEFTVRKTIVYNCVTEIIDEILQYLTPTEVMRIYRCAKLSRAVETEVVYLFHSRHFNLLNTDAINHIVNCLIVSLMSLVPPAFTAMISQNICSEKENLGGLTEKVEK